jgi:hypothetical protein
VTNCILWGNSSAMYNEGSTSAPVIEYSDVEGGCDAGTYNSCGAGNIDDDPLFVDTDDLRLQAASPCIGLGDGAALPADTSDLDGDGNTIEPLPLDLAGAPRVVDGGVDMGAFEHQ